MKKITLTRKAVFALFALLFAWNSYSQLPAFTLNATANPQTCTGNGSISFTTSGTTPGSTMSYALYLLPNTTDPVTLVTASPISSLAAGNYQLVATQSLGGESNQSTANVTIQNQAVPLVYNLDTTEVRCGNDGIITVEVTAGTAVAYEITAGPVIVPLQASNVFNNLPEGLYQVRVHDNCGDALVVSVQLDEATPNIIIGTGLAMGGELPSCDMIPVRHAFSTSTGSQIFYPITLEYTVFPPGGGAPVIITHTMPTGGSGLPSFNVTNNIPFYNGQTYTYNLEVTDACGNVYVRNNNSISPAFTVSPAPNADCTELFFSLFPNQYVGPYTVVFTDAPAGFVPTMFNAQHPTFPDGDALYKLDGTSVPAGSYTVQVTDACGRVATATFETIIPEVTPQVVAVSEGCTGLGSIEIEIPGRTIEEIEFTAAPPLYTDPLPSDVSEGITAEGWLMEDLPLGAYTIEVVDSCGVTHIIETEIIFTGSNPELQILQRPGCEIGFGSVRLRNVDSSITTITITAAPVAFTQNNALPFDASSNIAPNGMFYMNTLPAGSYTVNIVDPCGVGLTETFVVEGYNVTANSLTIIPLCNAFQLTQSHTSNGNYLQSFWLQQYDEELGAWTDPDSDAVYVEGTAPDATNSQIIGTSGLTYQVTGTFRILKVFYTYDNGTQLNSRCVAEIHNFDFIGRPVIHAAYGFPCSDGLTEVAVEATGLAPLTYEITTKDNAPFYVDNGNSNIFSGLEAATYNFRVTDGCGSFANIEFNINELEPIAIESANLCEGQDGLLSVPPFTFLSYEWYNVNAPATILSTTSTLPLAPFSNTIHPGTYGVRIFSSNPASCIDTELTFIVEPNNLPVAGADNSVIICNEGATLDLNQYLTGQDAGGTWADNSSTGALTGDMFNTDGVAQGIYTFTYSVEGDCDIIDDAILTIDLRDIPAMPVTTAVPALCEGSDIQLSVATVADAVYQWTGPNNFTSAEQNPLITAAGTAASGEYSVTVTVNGCTSAPAVMTINVNALPQFTVTGNTSLCNGQTSQLDVVGDFDTGATYEWYYEGVLQPANSGSIIIDQTGNYEVIVTTNGICQTAQQIEVTENTAAFEVVLEHGCRDFEYFITVVSPEMSEEASYTYEWEGPDGYTNSGAEINITDGAEGIYTVTVGNAEGCTATAFAEITNSACRIPKGISPGDADHNNSFDLSQLDVQQLQIYNRYGLQVYEKANYKDEWHGQGKGGDLPTGTYYYVISLSTGKRVTGWVYVQRQN